MDSSDWHKLSIRIPFASAKHALIAKRVIEVDQELQPQAVQRTLHVEKRYLSRHLLP
ncbi:hypothetical protein BD779DRAFT_587047 [Infundibulicybe gibba]|nr:hypothetical protein BD779DRAFT_587047 [Infundibulicybe gibba]